MKRDEVRVEVLNLDGDKVLISKDPFNVDFSGLSDGVYFVNYVDSNGYIFCHERILKTKNAEHAYEVI